jgi:hypothetical protein
VRRLVVCIAGIAALALVIPAAAAADLSSEVQQGQRLADSVKSGQRTCSALSTDQFELIGEYAMNTYLPSTAAHEAMNQHMAAMMGHSGEQRMHVVLGQRYSGCASGSASGWVAPMLGMMSRYGYGGGPGQSGMGAGMMYGKGYGPGPAAPSSSTDSGDAIGPAGIAAIAFGAALLAGLLVALGFWLRHRTA